MKRLSLAAAIAATFFVGSVWAEDITIANPSFELPAQLDGKWSTNDITGWTAITALGKVGVWNPSLTEPLNAGVTQEFLDGMTGDHVAFSNGGNIRQDLAIDVGYGYLYTLKVDVGGRIGYSDELYGLLLRRSVDGSTSTLDTLSQKYGRNIAGDWVEQTLTFEALNLAAADQKLVVVLSNSSSFDTINSDADGIQVNFDNVRLSRAALVSCEGFFPPFAEPLSLKAKSKRAIPVKMRLYGYDGIELTDADFTYPPVANVSFTPGTEGAATESDAALTVQSDDSNAFRYDPNEGQWILNLSTKPHDVAGTYTVEVVSGDPNFAVSSLGSCSQQFVRK